jgi:hypothetical protein
MAIAEKKKFSERVKETGRERFKIAWVEVA